MTAGFNLRLAVFAATLGAAVALSPVARADSGGFAPLVVDFQEIMVNSKAGQALQQQFKTQQELFYREVSKRQNEALAMQDDLQKQHAVLSAEAFDAKRKDYELKVQAYQKEADAKKQALQQGIDEATQKVKTVLVTIVKEIAEQRKVTWVENRNVFLMWSPTADITQEAMHKLDARLPTIALIVPRSPRGGSDDGSDTSQ